MTKRPQSQEQEQEESLKGVKRPRIRMSADYVHEQMMDEMDAVMSGFKFDEEPYEEFPLYFSTLYPHMMLIRQSRGYYVLLPPNQQDWSFEIRVWADKDVWYVMGLKSDAMEELSLRYTKQGTIWEGVPWYP